MARVLLLCGGQSEEHDVSLASARSVLGAIDGGLEVTPLVIDRRGRLLPAEASRLALADNSGALAPGHTGPLAGLDASAFDVVFPLLHGPFGEDGSVQGFLKLLGIPFVGSDVLGSAVGMDKLMMKSVFAAHGLPQVAYRAVRRRDLETDPDGVLAVLEPLGYPLFAKPANLGSSVGIGKATDRASLHEALMEAAQHDRRIIVEHGLDGVRELEVGVLGNDGPQASPVGEIVYGSDFYDYDTKYQAGRADLVIPAEIPADVAARCRELALRAFAAIDAAGLARVDFFYEPSTGDLYLNEINTMPGFTLTSMYPKLWAAAGLSYGELTERLVALALENR